MRALRRVYPRELGSSIVGKEIGASRQTTLKALLRAEVGGLVVRGERRGAWRAAETPELWARAQKARPALHAIQVAVPGFRLRGGLSPGGGSPAPARSFLSRERALTVQDGLVSVSATKAPIVLDEWRPFLAELVREAKKLGADIRPEEAFLVSFELNLDEESWSLRDVNNVRLQVAEGCWLQIYNKELPSGALVMRTEARFSPKGLTLQEATAGFEGCYRLVFQECIARLRELKGVVS